MINWQRKDNHFGKGYSCHGYTPNGSVYRVIKTISWDKEGWMAFYHEAHSQSPAVRGVECVNFTDTAREAIEICDSREANE